jgi:hypothetical protein
MKTWIVIRVLLHQAVQRGLLGTVALVVKRCAIRRPLGCRPPYARFLFKVSIKRAIHCIHSACCQHFVRRVSAY